VETTESVVGNDNTTSTDTFYMADDWRVFWSDSNELFLRSSTGLLSGMFDSSNATTCGSRLIQVNQNLNDMITSVELDKFLYHLACFFATIGYTNFHCYFMTKEVILDFINTVTYWSLQNDKGFGLN